MGKTLKFCLVQVLFTINSTLTFVRQLQRHMISTWQRAYHNFLPLSFLVILTVRLNCTQMNSPPLNEHVFALSNPGYCRNVAMQHGQCSNPVSWMCLDVSLLKLAWFKQQNDPFIRIGCVDAGKHLPTCRTEKPCSKVTKTHRFLGSCRYTWMKNIITNIILHLHH